MKYQHKNLAAGRWAQMSLSEQMANIGSEVTRALNWKRKNNEKYCLKSVERALELIALTIDNVTVKTAYCVILFQITQYVEQKYSKF